MLLNPLELMINPKYSWAKIAEKPASEFKSASVYPLVFALLPAAAWYFGTTDVGWTVTDGNVTRLTTDSAFKIVCAFYSIMVISVLAIGYSIHWMSDTYNSRSSINKGIAVAGFTATPLFIAGVSGIYPLLWFDLILGILALSWTIYLLYVGVPIVMHIPQEQGFLYASAIVAVGLVVFIAILVATAVLWQWGFMPVFTN